VFLASGFYRLDIFSLHSLMAGSNEVNLNESKVLSSFLHHSFSFSLLSFI
jgi:hypothetical protein